MTTYQTIFMQELINERSVQDLYNLITKKEYLIQAKKDLSDKPNLFTFAQREIWDMEIAILEDEVKMLKYYYRFISELKTTPNPPNALTMTSSFTPDENWVGEEMGKISKVTSVNTN